jgi:hypothetical protein
MATKAYAQRTIMGWFSGLHRTLAVGSACAVGSAPAGVGTPSYCELLSGAAEDYFNRTDRNLQEGQDAYVKNSFAEMCTEFRGALPCLFLDLLAKEICTLAIQIAVKPATRATALHSYEAHMQHVQTCIEEGWPASFEAQIRRFKAVCRDPAECARSCGGKLATQRFQFKLQIQTGPPALPSVQTNLTFVAKSCVVCGEAGALRCGRCKKSRYCGSRCQKAHWPQHRGECDPKRPNFGPSISHEP